MSNFSTKIKKVIKENRSIFICFVSSLPIVLFGVLAMIFLYTPTMEWQKTYNFILTPIFIIIYIATIEFATVVLPILFLRKKAKSQNTPNNSNSTESTVESVTK